LARRILGTFSRKITMKRFLLTIFLLARPLYLPTVVTCPALLNFSSTLWPEVPPVVATPPHRPIERSSSLLIQTQGCQPLRLLFPEKSSVTLAGLLHLCSSQSRALWWKHDQYHSLLYTGI
jgi:hypothetical protein